MTETQKATLYWLANGETGTSSKTLAFWVAFGINMEDGDHPHDAGDFNRCLKLLAAAPGLRTSLGRMGNISPVWAALVARWDEIERTFLEEVGLDWSKGRRLPAKKTYELMKEIIEGATQEQETAAEPACA